MSKALPYRPDIDGLRAVAILLVTIFHLTGLIKSGFVGVDIFFVISGFLITSIIVRDIKQGRFSFLEFYGRRIRRIFPALLVVLVVFLLAFAFIMKAQDYKLFAHHAMAGGFFVYNFLSAIDGVTNAFDHLWSLAVEEQFYIIWPLLLYVFYKARIAIVIPIMIIWGVSFYFYLFHFDYISSLSRFWQLASGGLVYLLAAANKKKLQKKIYTHGIAAAGIICLLLLFIGDWGGG